MKSHPHFEAVKVALKQDKTGYMLTLNIHPDEIDEAIMRDFVGSRYQVVMVRLDGNEKPMNREQEHAHDSTRMAGMLCRELAFHKFLYDGGHIFMANEEEATNWLKEFLGVQSRTEIKDNPQAQQKLRVINQEFQLWKTTV
jgi:hypothetical protein